MLKIDNEQFREFNKKIFLFVSIAITIVIIVVTISAIDVRKTVDKLEKECINYGWDGVSLANGYRCYRDIPDDSGLGYKREYSGYLDN